jgi:3-hydroxyisobutyrate dehydrogenase-like beta-hydroxyacid dehydrogenase
MEDCGSVATLAQRCDVLLCVCPPQAATGVAAGVKEFAGIYVDANAVSPTTATSIEARVARFVDGAIIGPPPRRRGTTRIYLSGPEARTVADLFAGTRVEPIVVSEITGSASAVKMAYSAWTKGTAALMLAIRSFARSANIEHVFLEEWLRALPDLDDMCEAAARSSTTYGWRWEAEINEIAESFSTAGLPDGFHRAAAEIYRRSPRRVDEGEEVEQVLAALRRSPREETLPARD